MLWARISLISIHELNSLLYILEILDWYEIVSYTIKMLEKINSWKASWEVAAIS
jgi:hypothetical protein